MDEPLSNLDAKLRVQMRAEIHHLQRRLGVTTIYVTHDQIEAMTMGDRVAVMQRGRLQQVDTPQVLYEQPVNEFVAGFIGSPSINMVEAELERANGGLAVTFGDHRLAVDDRARASSGPRGVRRTHVLGIRPEDLEDASLDPDARRPADRETLTPRSRSVPRCSCTSRRGPESQRRREDATRRSRGRRRTGRSEDPSRCPSQPRTRIAEAAPIELAVDTSRLYFFDPRPAPPAALRV